MMFTYRRFKVLSQTIGNLNKPLFRKSGGLLCLLFLITPGISKLMAQATKATNANVVITADNNLQYDLVRFKIKPGQRVKITLKNSSDMSHNFLLAKPGTRLKVVKAASQLAEKGPQMDFIPKTADVLWSIPVISPGQVKSVTFTAPSKPGVYPYVCTYPGHGFVMYGAMYVMHDGNMPEIKKDLSIPQTRRQEDKMNKNDKGVKEKKQDHAHVIQDTVKIGPHPYTLTPPYWYHAFLDGVSPAAIAVNLPKELSYGWDTESCRLRLAWKGGFIDMSDLWKGHFNASAKILGDIFLRENGDHPFRFGEKASVPDVIQYKGYRLIDQYPEFHYILNGVEVYELIKEKSDGSGLVRRFRIPGANDTIWFVTDDEENSIEYEFSTGVFKDGKLMLSPGQAKEFTVTMTSYYLAYKYKQK